MLPPSSSAMRAASSSASAPTTPAKPTTATAYTPRSPVDGKPSLLVRCSAGGETDPRMFYATTHRTYFHARNTMQNVTTERTLNTQFRWNDDSKVEKRVQAAGYQRNLLPCFEYDAGVDESDQFRTTDHFATTQSTSYTSPAAPPNVQTTKRINDIPDLSKYQPVQSAADVKLDGKWAEFESTMKASYREHAMFPHVDRTLPMTGLDHESGYDPMAPGTPSSPARVNRAANRSGYSNVQPIAAHNIYDPMAPGTPSSPARVNRAANRSGYSLCNRYEFEPFEPEVPEQHARAKTADTMLQAARDRREYSVTQRV
ncbi:hypothetical protein AMAG_20349 [Allomyces macrogynus ATCC 38327]|uniref:Uncharacterized protein n=1 Tax=Allomyces macrogynus (strain ATCC 38327) TaxID=578462 RepID=A0A0L0T9K4_ALLM3|nr:hypothetical protein AMAG_20349 [Allomyces macrogynus ATCC 38327]|eukprot:KNE71411.1 hypothetical protein AMAG_20349 [Allomyces macrogynus ATCC 38327]